MFDNALRKRHQKNKKIKNDRHGKNEETCVCWIPLYVNKFTKFWVLFSLSIKIGKFLSATKRSVQSCSWLQIGYRWIRQCKSFDERVNRITLRVPQWRVHQKNRCYCTRFDRYCACDRTKFCLYVSFRRRYDPNEKTYRPPSKMTVCARNCKPGYNCNWYFQSLGCKRLDDDDQVRNRWKEAYFEFNGRNKGIRVSLVTLKIF